MIFHNIEYLSQSIQCPGIVFSGLKITDKQKRVHLQALEDCFIGNNKKNSQKHKVVQRKIRKN